VFLACFADPRFEYLADGDSFEILSSLVNLQDLLANNCGVRTKHLDKLILQFSHLPRNHLHCRVEPASAWSILEVSLGTSSIQTHLIRCAVQTRAGPQGVALLEGIVRSQWWKVALGGPTHSAGMVLGTGIEGPPARFSLLLLSRCHRPRPAFGSLGCLSQPTTGGKRYDLSRCCCSIFALHDIPKSSNQVSEKAHLFFSKSNGPLSVLLLSQNLKH
jgi:hypothetical protein